MNEFPLALAALPRADNHKANEAVVIDEMYVVPSHRKALDLDRALVVGNRGMGKSFWAHALVNADARKKIAKDLKLPELATARVRIGFNASSGTDGFAPTASMLNSALQKGFEPKELFMALLVRVLALRVDEQIPPEFETLLTWVREHSEIVAKLIHRAEQIDVLDVVVFDALDRLSDTPDKNNNLIKGLLEVSLQAISMRSIRFKIFIRSDQYADAKLFEFADASKLKNQAAKLVWLPEDLYSLLFFRLRVVPCFRELLTTGSTLDHVNAIAGEFMGKDKRRGRVWTWLITHLADANGEISPRTFLTVWQVAAVQAKSELASPRAVDPISLGDGVREASEDRLNELGEDYPWVNTLLEPLRGKAVPLLRTELEKVWKDNDSFLKVKSPKTIWISTAPGASESDQLISALELIGVAEVRLNQKINVPDIFRVHAGIKRLGGVPPRAKTTA